MITKCLRFAYECFLVWRDEGTYIHMNPQAITMARDMFVSDICEVFRPC